MLRQQKTLPLLTGFKPADCVNQLVAGLFHVVPFWFSVHGHFEANCYSVNPKPCLDGRAGMARSELCSAYSGERQGEVVVHINVVMFAPSDYGGVDVERG